ncbi:MAG TPA: M20 family metallopeptidase [Solirubrobacteraceae bacterium]|jgi:amidohydrolase|nr:M20 family metallopeptidase [Solirubrobacteraceae bacterium]
MPTSTELLTRLLARLEREWPAAVELRHRLHANPELAHAEDATAAMVVEQLPVQAVSASGTGRLARVGSGDGAPVAVRAELDGLPVRERTNAPFSARGGVMHACGHDVHMAALVALARAAHALGDELPAPLLAVFQPSEEAYPSGAQQLAEGELAAAAPRAIVAVHIHPELPWRALALDAGTVNASCDAIEIVVTGAGTHGAYPHRGRDPVLALAHVVVALHAQAPQRLDPLHPGVVTVGVLAADGAENVIPERAVARGTLRAYRDEDRQALRETVAEVVAGIAAAHGCEGSVQLTPGEPALANDPALVSSARALLGVAGLQAAPPWRSAGSDDFAFFAALAPLALGFVGLAGADGFVPRPLHHPELFPPDSAVAAVARAQALLYVAAACR